MLDFITEEHKMVSASMVALVLTSGRLTEIASLQRTRELRLRK